MRHNKPLTENIRWLFIGNILTNLISLVISVFLIRKLAISDFGIYSMFMGSFIVFSIFSINPVLVSLRRFIPELVQKKYYAYLKSMVYTLILISLSLGSLMILLVYFGRVEVGHLLNIDHFGKYYSLFIINIIIYFVISLNNAILISLHEQKIISILNIISVVVRGILYAVFFSVITISLIFIIEAASQSIKAVFSSYFVKKKIKSLNEEEGLVITTEEKLLNLKRLKRFTFLSTANEAGSRCIKSILRLLFYFRIFGCFSTGIICIPV